MSKKKRLVMKIGTCGLVISLTACSTLGAGDEKQRPELTGVWTNASLTNLTRPSGVDKLVLSPEEARKLAANTGVAGISPEEAADDAATDPNAPPPPKGSSDFGLRGYNSFWIDPGSSLARVRGEFRSSYIIEPSSGQVPRLKNPKVKLKDHGFGRRYVTGIGDASGPEALPLAERCLLGFGNTAGPGMMGTLYNSTYQFVQTDEHVMILVEMAHDARIIPTFASKKEAQANHRPAVMKPWFGDSVGWYEGNTLVVETTNIKPLQMEQSSVPITQDGKFVERFTRHSETEIVYQFTVEDSNLYSQPWTAELSFHATEGPVYEYACHEGNYAMEGILAGARKKERDAAAGGN